MIQDKIFIEYTPKSNLFLDESFLELDFDLENYRRSSFDNLLSPNIHCEDSVSFQPIDFPSDQIQNTILLEQNKQKPFSYQNQFPNQIQLNQNSTNKAFAKSTKTKNICFNICQKTVKVMKSRIYNETLDKISSEYGLKSEIVIEKTLKIKKDLTGPKALKIFVEANDAVSKVFKKFMKWFLKQKYLRHAINEGTMDDLKGYLQFKNQVILNLLEE